MRARKETPIEFQENNWQKVEFLHETTIFLDYKVGDHTVSFYKNGRKPLCSCAHGSFYGILKEFEYCRHIQLVKTAIRKRGSMKWKEQSVVLNTTLETF